MVVCIYDFWGVGGYVWVWFDVIFSDLECLIYMDVDYFLDGVFDILEC